MSHCSGRSSDIQTGTWIKIMNEYQPVLSSLKDCLSTRGEERCEAVTSRARSSLRQERWGNSIEERGRSDKNKQTRDRMNKEKRKRGTSVLRK